MAQQRTGVLSPTGDALLLAALFLPFAPIVAVIELHMLTSVLGCPEDITQACSLTGIDFNHLAARSMDILDWTATASRVGGLLLVYILLLAGLAQFTTEGFRGRVVRTCAVIMWAGVLPLVLTLASKIARAPEQLCGNGLCDARGLLHSLAFFGNVFFDWLADIAVPLAVLVTAMLSLTMGYRMLIGRMVQFATKRN
jgi:hypothetical protein